MKWSLRFFLWLATRTLPVLAVLIVLLHSIPEPLAFGLVPAFVVYRFVRTFYKTRPIRALRARTRSFVRVWAGRFDLRYDSRLRGTLDAQAVLREANEALTELESVLGKRGRHALGSLVTPALERQTITIFVFPGVDDIREISGQDAAGVAMPMQYWIALAWDQYPLREVLRHEIVHLYMSRPWNQATPPLLSEGLAVWLQGAVRGIPVDRAAARCVASGYGSLRLLLNSTQFFGESDHRVSYVLAGSVTGFLIRRFGRDAYLNFYNDMYNGRQFDEKFSSHFGLTLEQAEEFWREEIVDEHGDGQEMVEGAVPCA